MATQPSCLTRERFLFPLKWSVICFFRFLYDFFFWLAALHWVRFLFPSNYLTFWFVRFFFSIIETVQFCWRLMQDIKLFFIFHNFRFILCVFFSSVARAFHQLFIHSLKGTAVMRMVCKNTTDKIKGKIIAEEKSEQCQRRTQKMSSSSWLNV